MCRVKVLVVFFIIFLTANVLHAQDYTVQKLANGQTVVVYENHTNPIVTVDTWVRTGSINENDNNSGISHFLEHLSFKGTKLHPVGEVNKIIESKGAIFNAATSKDFTHYYITIPSKYFDTALELQADMLLNPQIPRKELESERKVVLEEISMNANSPSKNVYENMNALMYTTHPYKRIVIGNADIIGKIRREEILDYYNKYYIPSNMITVVTGDVDAQAAINKIQNAFNAAYKKPVVASYKKEKPISVQRRKVEYDDVQNGYMMIGFRGVDINNKDMYVLDVLSEVLGGNSSSILNKNLKDQKALVSSISSYSTNFKDDGILYISTNFSPQNAARIEKEIFDQIEKVQKYGVTEEEINTAKNKIIQKTCFSRETTEDMAFQIGYSYLNTGSLDLYNKYIDEIKKIDAKSVQRAANKYLGIDKSAVSVILPLNARDISDCEKKSYDVKKVSAKDGVAKYTVSNGATILINQNDKNDILAVCLIFKGGEFIEVKHGEGTFVAKTLLKGTRKYSSQQLAEILDRNGITLTPECDGDFFMIKVKTTTDKLEITLDIINEIVNNASFSDYEIEKVRSEIMSKIKQKRDIPRNVAQEAFKTVIYENSAYSVTNKVIEKNLPTISREDLLRYYKNITDAKNVVVSVNGNVNDELFVSKIAAILKDKNAPKVNLNTYNLSKLSKPQIITHIKKDLKTAWLYLGWQTPGVQDRMDFATLKVINTMLGSGLSSRLYTNIRESDGLAYSIGSTYTAKALGGIFVVNIGTNPDTYELSKSKIFNEINRLKIEFVSDSELKNAKERLKGGLILALETNDSKALNIGLFEAYGVGYDFIKSYIDLIDKVTASDIIKVSNKYFTQNYVLSDIR